jgi:hypothetical protein
MSLLFLTAGTKGGIGKTFAATMLADTAIRKNIKTVLFDCDNENKSLLNSYPHPAKNCRVMGVDLNSKEAKVVYPLDAVVNDIIKTEKEAKGKKNIVYIVDMKAGTTHYTLDWMEDFPFNMIRSLGVQIYIMGCITADIDSVQTLSRWVSRYREDVKNGLLRFLIVKNHFQGNEFSSYDNLLSKNLEGANPVILELPRIEEWYLKTIKENNTTYGQIGMKKLVLEALGEMGAFRIEKHFEIMSEGFASILRTLDKK